MFGETVSNMDFNKRYQEQYVAHTCVDQPSLKCPACAKAQEESAIMQNEPTNEV